MKKYLFAAFFFAVPVFATYGQKITTTQKDFQKSDPTFFDIQREFYAHYDPAHAAEPEDEDGNKDGEFEKFKRWEWYWQPRVGTTGKFPAPDVLLTEWNKYVQSHPNAASRIRTVAGSGGSGHHAYAPSVSGSWTSLGPTTSPSNYQDIGRVNCIAFDSLISTTFWIGSPDGGLWKTTDGGTTWTTNTDNLPVLGVSDIAIDNQHRDTMYIATGDGDGANTGSGGDSKSVGVLKTTDGGVTWNTTGLSWTLASVNFIKRLILDPTNPSVLIAATSNGIYRTTNGGTTWTNTRTGYFMDMQMNPGNHNILCATTYSYGGGAQIYQSTNNGVTWTSVYTGAGIARIKLAVTPASVNKVDALCVDATSWGFNSIMHSTDGGATWVTALTINAGCTNDYMDDANNASGCYGQGYYDVGFACSPTNPNELYLGGVNTWKSTDNGATWTIKNYWSGGGGVPTVHADKHWFTYQPSTGVFFEGNDGGIYKTADGGTTWTHLSNGLVISEIYRIGTSATSAGDVICGLQDNGSKEDVAGTWSNRTGGDGMEALIDYTNVNIQYSTYVQGLIYRTTNHWGSNTTLVNNNAASGVNSAGLWVTPYVENPLNHNGLYVGKDQLYRGFNAGSAATAGAVTWVSISSSLTFPTSSSQLINAIAVAPTDSNTIYIACDNYLYRTTTGGSSWTLVNTAAENITYIAINNTNPNNVWFTLSVYTAGSKVFVTTTGGASWTNISGTLPNIPVNTIVYSNTGSNGEYIGTDLGVYYLGTSASDWVPFNTGLPNVVVDELEICYANSKIYAATFGRGLWSSDLFTNVAPITGTFTVCVNSTTPLSDATSGGTWSSSSANATVGSTGIVTGVTAGTATISYTVGSTGTVTAVVTVVALPSAISPAGASVCVGSTVNLTDVTTGGTWSSVNATVGTISSGGTVTGISTGTTIISYTASTGCAVTVVTTVNAAPTAVITPAGPTTFCSPVSVVLNSSTAAGYTYQWELGGVNITGATTSSYTASTGGSYTIFITGSGCSATSAPVAVTVNSVSVSPITGSGLVCIGQTTPLSDVTTGGVWNSGAPGTASVSGTGMVTGITAGTATISYSYTNSCGTAIATTVVTVSAGTAVAPITGTAILCAGGNTPLSDITTGGAWSSSNAGVAGVSGTGLVSGVAGGTAVISYGVTSGSGCVTSSVITVTVNPKPAAIVSPTGPIVICPSGSVLFTASSGAGYSYQWQDASVNIPGATTVTYTASTAGSFDVVVSALGCSATSATVIVTVEVGAVVVPSVSVTSSLGTVLCASGTSETFTANPLNGGASPSYQWSVNGVVVGAGASYTYAPANGDAISCLLTSNAACAMPDTASATVIMTISPLITPSVSITSIHNDSTCIGDTVQFAAVPVFGGTAPTYLWTENGVNVATGPYYIYAPHDGDTLIVTMTSNYPCLATSVAVSNMFIIHAFTSSANVLSVSVSQSSIVSGSVDTFTAVASGAGASPTFQWFINGTAVPGATGRQYITDSLTDGQIVSCEETSSFLCSSPHSVFSGGISIIVRPSGITQVGLNATKLLLEPNPNKGAFTIKGLLRTYADEQVDIVVTNVLGQTVYKNTATAANGALDEHISLSGSLPSGTYLVSVASGYDYVVFHVLIE